MQYRSILKKTPQHSRALQECLKESGLDDYDRIFLHVFAPAAAEFTAWVLDRARKDGKKRLYFLARDGYMLYHAMQQLVSARGFDIELRYLKVSRYAVRMAQYHRMGSTCVDFICSGGIGITFEKMMKRAALTEEEALAIAGLAGFAGRYREVLNYRQILQLREKLRQIPLLFEYVSAHSKACYGEAFGYLKQEGLMEDVPYALVDSGWIGTLQQSIEQVSGRPQSGYYFGLYEIPKNADPKQYQAFYFMPKTKIRRKAFFSNCLFEGVFSAPEGMTMEYRRRAGQTESAQYEAVESERKNPNQKRLLRSDVLLKRYMKEYCRQETGGNGRKTVEKLLAGLMAEPALFEAETLGSQLFCDDVLELGMQPLAAAFTDEDLKKRRIFRRILQKTGIRKEKSADCAWPEAGITMSGGAIKKNLRQERLYKYIMYAGKAMKAR